MKKKSASSHDEAALLGKKYHIAAKLRHENDLSKYFEHYFVFKAIFVPQMTGFGYFFQEKSHKSTLIL